MEEAWGLAGQRLGEDALTQDEAIRLLGQLHAADVLVAGDVPPDFEELADRGRRQRRRKLLTSVINPLALRVPLFDPNEALDALQPLARLAFSGLGAMLFVILLCAALLAAGQYWGELTGNLADQVLATESLLLLLLTYPVVKLFHELGHALAVKRWGGEVHEVGVMLLVLLPVPYVDASDSMSFASRWRRAVVGAAGILVELTLASIAMLVWVQAEPGLLRAFCFSVMLIAGVSTLLFNGNPLLRFDGYYVLSDLLGIPNLAQRANAYLGYLVQRHGFGVSEAISPATAPGEAGWFLFYAVSSFVYRLFVAIAIALLVGTQFFIIGVLVAMWSMLLMIGLPLAKCVHFLLANPALRRRRGRAVAVTGGALAAVVAGLFALPLPHATMAEGVVWMAGDAALHAGTEGTVAIVHAAPGDLLRPGAPVLTLEDPTLAGRARLLAGRVVELEAHHAMRDLSDPVRARITLDELNLARADLALARERMEQLVVRSRAEGRLSLPRPDDLIGRHVRRGDLLGYVARPDEPLVRVVVPESEADLVLQRTEAVALRLASRMGETLAARVERIVPRLEESLPNAALATAAGGSTPLDPTDPNHNRTLGRVLQLDLALEVPREGSALFGERAFVRFSHGEEPLAERLWRGLRQTFMGRFAI